MFDCDSLPQSLRSTSSSFVHSLFVWSFVIAYSTLKIGRVTTRFWTYTSMQNGHEHYYRRSSQHILILCNHSFIHSFFRFPLDSMKLYNFYAVFVCLWCAPLDCIWSLLLFFFHFISHSELVAGARMCVCLSKIKRRKKEWVNTELRISFDGNGKKYIRYWMCENGRKPQ